MTLALLLIFVGGILVYAAIKGRSVRGLLLGDNRQPSANQGLPK